MKMSPHLYALSSPMNQRVARSCFVLRTGIQIQWNCPVHVRLTPHLKQEGHLRLKLWQISESGEIRLIVENLGSTMTVIKKNEVMVLLHQRRPTHSLVWSAPDQPRRIILLEDCNCTT